MNRLHLRMLWCALDVEFRASELARRRWLHFAAERVCHDLQPVADAENGDAEVEDFRIAARRVRFIDAAGPAGQDEAFGVELAEVIGGNVWADELTEDAFFAHPPGDELGVLRAKIEDR